MITSLVSSITSSGTTVTYKNSAGTTLGTFTTQDTNTWRGIVNALNSTSTTDSLSANQGRIIWNRINENKSANVTISNKGTAATVYRNNNVVWFMSLQDATSIQAGGKTVGTIPAGYRPTQTIRLPVANNTSNMFVEVYSNGTINHYSQNAFSSATNDTYWGCWITNNTYP